MGITLDQAQALDALARHGSVLAAAKALRRSHAALLYTLKSLEDTAKVALLDRSSYRTGLTPAGHSLWQICQKLIEAGAEADAFMGQIHDGWEPELRIVFDGFLAVSPLLEAIHALRTAHQSTRVSLFCEYLNGVETCFEAQRCDLMISVVVPAGRNLVSRALPRVKSVLVAGSSHPLTKGRRSAGDLQKAAFLAVHGSEHLISTSTSVLAKDQIIQLNDFHAKREALLQGLGYGWMPDYLVKDDLKRRKISMIRWSGENEHYLQPVLYTRPGADTGKGMRRIIEAQCERPSVHPEKRAPRK